MFQDGCERELVSTLHPMSSDVHNNINIHEAAAAAAVEEDTSKYVCEVSGTVPVVQDAFEEDSQRECLEGQGE